MVGCYFEYGFQRQIIEHTIHQFARKLAEIRDRRVYRRTRLFEIQSALPFSGKRCVTGHVFRGGVF